MMLMLGEWDILLSGNCPILIFHCTSVFQLLEDAILFKELPVSDTVRYGVNSISGNAYGHRHETYQEQSTPKPSRMDLIMSFRRGRPQ